jgi:hypothetical protein
MKKSFYSKVCFAGLTIMATLMFSCKKEITGPQGNAGPSLTGNIAGFVLLYDQYGTRIYTNLNKITVSISNRTTISHADSTGKYLFSNLSTGIYNITASDSLYGAEVAPQFQFVGGGNLDRDFKLSQIPTFTLSSCTAIDTVSSSINYIKVKGTLLADTKARTIAVFVGTSSSVSSAPANYILMYSKQVAANATSFNIQIPATDLYNIGITSASTAYFAAYPAAVNFSTTSSYEDFATGRTFYNSVGTSPINCNAIVP